MSLEFRRGDPGDPRVAALIAAHHAHAHAHSPPESVFALDTGGLGAEGVEFVTLWEGSALLGMGALRRLGPGTGEIKSMHVAEAARGRGLARVILRQLEARARQMGLETLFLETGSMDAYAPARALYAAEGYRPCGRFGDYPEDPNSAYMTKELAP